MFLSRQRITNVPINLEFVGGKREVSQFSWVVVLACPHFHTFICKFHPCYTIEDNEILRAKSSSSSLTRKHKCGQRAGGGNGKDGNLSGIQKKSGDPEKLLFEQIHPIVTRGA